MSPEEGGKERKNRKGKKGEWKVEGKGRLEREKREGQGKAREG